MKDIEVAELVERYRDDKRTLVPDNEVMSLLDIIEQQAAALTRAQSTGAGPPMVGEFKADYSPLTPEEIAAGECAIGEDCRCCAELMPDPVGCQHWRSHPATPAGDDVERLREALQLLRLVLKAEFARATPTLMPDLRKRIEAAIAAMPARLGEK